MPFLHSHPAAASEAEASALWYESRQAGLGEDFLAELDRGFDLILESPATWPLWPGLPEALGIRRFLLPRFPFGVAYEIAEGGVIVYAVANLARRPGYWANRLAP